MSGETEQHVSGWTVDTVHSHFLTLIGELDKRYEQRFHAQQDAVVLALNEADKRYEQRFAAQQEAISKSDKATQDRFESVNEFRGQLNDQSSKLVTRTEMDAVRGELLGAIKAMGDRLEATVTANAEKIAGVTTRLERQEGRDRGIQAGWGYLVAGIGLIATIGTIVALIIGLQ